MFGTCKQVISIIHILYGGSALNKRGVALVAAIMLVVFSAIAVLGVTAFIVQCLAQVEVNRVSTACIYLAHAGVNKAIYDYRTSGAIPAGRTDIDADNFFVVGASSGALLGIDASGWHWAPTAGPPGLRYRDLAGLVIENLSGSEALTIASMQVAWDNTRRIRAISIDGSAVWTGNAASPADCDITDFTLSAGGSYNIDYLNFNGDMSGATATISFTMADGSTHTIGLDAEGSVSSDGFGIQVTGKTTGSNIYRTVSIDYDSINSNITSYTELNTEVTP